MSPEKKRFRCKLDPTQKAGCTLFRIEIMKGYLFTFSPWSFEGLEFVVKNDDLKPNNKLQLKDLDAWSIAGAYIIGKGFHWQHLILNDDSPEG